MSHLNGMHGPDGGYTFNENLLNDVATGGMVLLDFQLRTNPYTRMNSNWECDNWLWAWLGVPGWGGGDPRGILANPNRVVAVRQYMTDWREWMLKQDATGRWLVDTAKCRRWAQIAVEQLSTVRGGKFHPDTVVDLFSKSNVILFPNNEPEIEPSYIDGLTNTEYWYDLIGAAWIAWANEIDRLRPDRRCLLGTSPLAGGHDIPGWAPDEEYQTFGMKEMILQADVLNAHVYGHLNQNPAWGALGKEAFWHWLRLWRPKGYKNSTEGWTGGDDPGGAFVQYPHKPKIVSETGGFHHERVEWTEEVWPHFEEFYQWAEADGNVIFVAPFTWDSSSYHEGNRIARNSWLRQKFSSMRRYAGRELPVRGEQPRPQPPTPKPEEPVPTFNTNPNGRSVYGPGALNQLATEQKWQFMSDECTMKGDTGANVVTATLRDPATNKFYFAVWSPGFDKAHYCPLT